MKNVQRYGLCIAMHCSLMSCQTLKAILKCYLMQHAVSKYDMGSRNVRQCLLLLVIFFFIFRGLVVAAGYPMPR